MVPDTPYTRDLEGRDPLVAMPESIAAIADTVAGWTPDQFERPYAPGKWTARQILIHLVQTELALGTRARMALTTSGLVARSFDQDGWLRRELGLSGQDAVRAFVPLAMLNCALYRTLSGDDRQTAFVHDVYGPLTVDWIIYQQAGHQVHHLKQLQAIGRA